MKRIFLRRRDIVLVSILLLLAGGSLYYGIVVRPKRTPTEKVSSTVVLSGVANLASPSKFEECHVRGPLPDPDCTPGAVFPISIASQLCVPGYAHTVRNVSAETKRQIYVAYGLSYPQSAGNYEADHLIPLELGGSNEVSNLFPEAASPTPGFHEKDLVENYLHEEVCAGRKDLVTAQTEIAQNWLLVYQHLTAADINRLKAEVKAYGD